MSTYSSLMPLWDLCRSTSMQTTTRLSMHKAGNRSQSCAQLCNRSHGQLHCAFPLSPLFRVRAVCMCKKKKSPTVIAQPTRARRLLTVFHGVQLLGTCIHTYRSIDRSIHRFHYRFQRSNTTKSAKWGDVVEEC
jgi:hypothetical protein